MGMFSNKTKYIVNTTIANVFEESNIPNSAKAGIVRGILGDTDIQAEMMEELLSSIGVRADTGYMWAKDNYSLGCPNAGVKNYLSAETLVKQAIESNIGQSVTLQYYRMAPINSMHFAWSVLFSQLGYNASTNEIVGLAASTGGKKCYLYDVVATYRKESYDFLVETSDLGVLDQMGPSPTSGYTPSRPFNVLQGIGQMAAQPSYVVSSVATEDYLTIVYEFEEYPGYFVQRGFTVTLMSMSEPDDYHMARYTTASGNTGFFTYMQGAGTYPLVDQAMVIAHNDLGTYYPWAYYMLEGRDAWRVLTEAQLEEMRQWTSYLGVNYDTIDEAVHQDQDLSDVEQVIQLFGCKPGATTQAELEYLFKHFSILHANSVSQWQLAPSLTDKMNAFTSSPTQVQRIQDSQFAMSMQYSGIVKIRRTGVIGRVGEYTGELKQVAQNTQVFASQDGGGMSNGEAVPTQPAYIYRFQVMDTVYEEVAVYNLRMDYEVHRKKGLTAMAGSPELFIPVDRAIVATIGITRREELLCRSLKLVVNTVQAIKQPWYASSGFRILMLVVAVVITIMSLGQAWQSIVAAASLGYVALAVTVLTLIVQAIVVTYAVKLFVKLVGPKVAIIAAIAAMVVGSYANVTNQSWGDSLIAIGNNMVSEANKAYADMLEDIQVELADYMQWAKGQFENLDDKKDQLGLNAAVVGLEVDDVVRMGPRFVPGESPNDYYARTVHSGNIGVLSYDMIEYYHSAALTLPRLSNNDYGDSNDGLAIF